MIEEYQYQPGNGTNYHILYGQPNPHHKTLLCWLRKNGSGGTCFYFEADIHIHYSYLQEKMDINSADANAILLFLQKKGHDVTIAPELVNFEAPDFDIAQLAEDSYYRPAQNKTGLRLVTANETHHEEKGPTP